MERPSVSGWPTVQSPPDDPAPSPAPPETGASESTERDAPAGGAIAADRSQQPVGPVAPIHPRREQPVERDAETILEEVLGGAGADDSRPGGLTKQEIDMLAFERQWWRQPGAKEQAIRDRFQVSPTRYYQHLNALLDSPAALEYDPALVNRLRRLRTTRLRGRGTG